MRCGLTGECARGDKREDCWIWTAVVEEKDGSRWVDFEAGDRSEVPFLRLYERLPEAERHCSDGYAVYDWLPTNRHEVGKYGSVNWNEGLHLVWSGNLNRLVRRTKGYTKSIAMLVRLLAVLGQIQLQCKLRMPKLGVEVDYCGGRR